MFKNPNEIIFLGTGTSQGVPVIGCKHPVCLSKNPKDKRLRTSAFIKTKGINILLDCGPDFRQQMLRENLDYIDVILLTHEHNDHIIGLDDVRPINFLTKKNIPIYALPRVIKEVKDRFSYAFVHDKYPGAPEFQVHEISSSFLDIFGVHIIPLNIMHGNLPILGYRIGNLAYLTDVNFIPKETMAQLKGLDILVIDALRKSPKHHSHLTLDEAIEYAKEINPKQTYFIHINHNIGFHDVVEEELPDNFHLAYDGLRLKFSS